MKKQILLLSLLSLFSFTVFAGPVNTPENTKTQETPELSQDLLLDLRITTALYRAGLERVELNQDEVSAIEDAEWIAEVQEIGTAILKEKKVSEADIKKVEWRNVARKTGGFFVKLYKKFRTSSRLNGVDVGIVLLLTNSLENLIPIFLVGAGQPGLAAVAVFLPTGEVLTGGYALFKKFLNQRKVRRMYGDKELYKFHRDLDDKVTEQLHLKKDDTLLLPVRTVDEKVVLIAVNKKRQMGKHKMTFAKARDYALEHGMTKKDLRPIEKSKEKKLMKLILLIESFYGKQSTEWLSAFEQQFSESIVVTSNLESTKELRTWARGIKNVKDCDEFRTLIKQSPAGRSSREMIVLIKDVLFTTIAETMKGWKTGMFKRMRKGLQKIEVQINIEENPAWDSVQIDRMDTMLLNACH